MTLKPSALATSGKSPEYGEFWKDGLLKVTIVTGKYAAGGKDDSDAGVASYNELYDSLLRAFGPHRGATLPFQGQPGSAHPRVDLEFKTARGRMEVALFLTDGAVRREAPLERSLPPFRRLRTWCFTTVMQG
jgi:hypothetical protein